jgi:hypothetical protein
MSHFKIQNNKNKAARCEAVLNSVSNTAGVKSIYIIGAQLPSPSMGRRRYFHINKAVVV